MPELHVRNLPPWLHERLHERAESEGRSMSAEAIAIMKAALQPGESEPSVRQQAALRRLDEIRSRSRLAATDPTAEKLVREDRDAL